MGGVAKPRDVLKYNPCRSEDVDVAEELKEKPVCRICLVAVAWIGVRETLAWGPAEQDQLVRIGGQSCYLMGRQCTYVVVDDLGARVIGCVGSGGAWIDLNRRDYIDGRANCSCAHSAGTSEQIYASELPSGD